MSSLDENKVRRPDPEPADGIAEGTAHEYAQLTLAGLHDQADVVTDDPRAASLAAFRIGYWLGRQHHDDRGAPWDDH